MNRWRRCVQNPFDCLELANPMASATNKSRESVTAGPRLSSSAYAN